MSWSTSFGLSPTPFFLHKLHITQVVAFSTSTVYHARLFLSIAQNHIPIIFRLSLNGWICHNLLSQSLYSPFDFVTHLLGWNLDLRSEKHKETENCLNPKLLMENRRLPPSWVKEVQFRETRPGGQALLLATLSALQEQPWAPALLSSLLWFFTFLWVAQGPTQVFHDCKLCWL